MNKQEYREEEAATVMTRRGPPQHADALLDVLLEL